MKRLKKSLAFLLLLTSAGFAEVAPATKPAGGYLELRAGGYFPFTLPVGFSGGVTLGKNIDEVVSFNGGLDYYLNTPTSSVSTNTNQFIGLRNLGAVAALNIFTLSANFRVTLPLKTFIDPWIQVGVSANLLANIYNSVTTGQTNAAYLGIGGLFEVGARVRLGASTHLVGAIALNLCDGMRSSVTGSTVADIVTLSGLQARLGLGFML